MPGAVFLEILWEMEKECGYLGGCRTVAWLFLVCATAKGAWWYLGERRDRQRT
jgi:hypothetical protein